MPHPLSLAPVGSVIVDIALLRATAGPRFLGGGRSAGPTTGRWGSVRMPIVRVRPLRQLGSVESGYLRKPRMGMQRLPALIEIVIRCVNRRHGRSISSVPRKQTRRGRKEPERPYRRAEPRERPLDETILQEESTLQSEETSSLDGNISSRVGARVRAAREHQGETLRAFAARAGVSASMLSDVERGAKSPTIAILSAIAEGLGMPLSSLVSDEHPLEAGPRIIRAADMPLVIDPESTIKRYHLGPVVTESNIEFLRFILPPGSSTGSSSEHEHGTIERVYVMQGRVEVVVGGKRFTLGTGDAAVYRAAVAHGLHAPPDEAAEVYLVIERP